MSSAVDLHELLRDALDAPPERRAAFLDAACAGDAELRAQLERLLQLAECGDGFLDRSPITQPSSAPSSDLAEVAGRVVGAYRLLEPIGHGGMSEVWLAERVEGGFRQQVAIKLIHGPLGAAERFRAEREILAGLAHPGIARLYDGGVEPGGGAWMAMEYVEGEHLAAYCRAHALPLAERLALFLQVCDAVAYAHTHLVVHRDLKPANILVTAEGQTKLLDFGIARLLDEDAREATRTIRMTPAYAAPEQLSGGRIGTASDVYALGVILFELLTDRLPWSDDSATLASAVQRLLDAPPPVPSRFALGDAPIARRALRGDLDAIVAKALRKEPDARYPDARALADDVRRHLAHEPVRARAGARSYVLRRSLRRHWLALSAAAAVFVAMAAAIVVVAQQVKKARLEAQRAAAVQAFMVDLFRTNSSSQPDPVKARATTARELLDVGAKRIETQMDAAPENKLALLRLFGDLYGEFALSTEQLPVRRQAVALSRSLYDADSPELASDLVAQARATRDHDEAERLIDEAGAILDRRHDKHSPLRARQLLAEAINNDSSDLARTRAAATRAIAILETLPESAQLAEASYALGMALCGDGDYADAIAPLKRAIDVSIRTQGVPNPKLSTYYEQLGTAQAFSNRYAEAETSIAQAIEQAHENKAEYDYDRVQAETTMALLLFNEDQPVRSLAFAVRAKTDAPLASEGADAALLRAYVFDTASRALLVSGEPAGALADAQTAAELARLHDADGLTLVSALQRKVEALIELGRLAEAASAMQEAVNVLHHARGAEPNRLNMLLQIEIAVNQGDLDRARTLFATLSPGGGDARTVTPNSYSRNLAAARIDLAAGDHGAAARLAAAAVEQIRARPQAAYLRLEIADGELLEGLARVRGGDAADARGLLADALAIRTQLLLPKSPRIAEAELALAECELALGRRAEAAARVAKAEAIERQHVALSARYRAPLEKLRAQLRKTQTGRAAGTAASRAAKTGTRSTARERAHQTPSVSYSSAFAIAHSRCTVRSEMPSASAVSVSE